MPGRSRRGAALAAVWCLLGAGAAVGEVWERAALYGADVRSLAFDPAAPERALAGTSAGHVYRSDDGGASWRDAGPAVPFPGWVVEDLVFDPRRPGRVWAALWGVWGGGLVASSDDLGASWLPRGEGLPGSQVYALTLAPGPAGRLYAATRDGVYGSLDGGGTWRHLTAGLPEIEKVTSLLVDPVHTLTVIAGTWRRAYRSDDGGGTWRGIFDGMVLDSEIFGLVAVPGRPGEMWASTCGWVYRGEDWGRRWTRYRRGFEERRSPSLDVLPDGTLLAGTVAGLYRSRDGGQTWERRTGEEISVLAIAHHPERPQRVLLGTEGAGVWRSEDGAGSFQPASRGMTNLRVSGLALAGAEVVAAVRHAGPLSGVYRSRDGGRTFQLGPEALPTVLDLAAEGERLFAATEGGLFAAPAGGGWRRQPDLGDGRVEEVVAGPGRVVVRTPGGLYEGRDGGFVPLPYEHGRPRSAALAGEALWVTGGDGLYRLAAGADHAVPAPAPGGRLAAAGGTLALAAPAGGWVLEAGGSEWRAVTEGPARAFATGDDRYPILWIVAGREARLADRATGELLSLSLPLPVRDVTSALVVGERLLVGTSGHGILVRHLGG